MLVTLAGSMPEPASGEVGFVLHHSNWNDWWQWETLFSVVFHDSSGQRSLVGATKIAAQTYMDGRKPALPASFDGLEDDFFSLGQDESYYAGLMALPNGIGRKYLLAVNDVVARDDLFMRHENSPAMAGSLLRNVSIASVKGQYHRIVNGEAAVRSFDVSYNEPSGPEQATPVTIRFVVSPESLPPTNIHVLIGRNGSGKTRLLQRMAAALIDANGEHVNHFASEEGLAVRESIAGVGHISFSAFDRNPPLAEDTKRGLNVFNVGLKKVEAYIDPDTGAEKSRLVLKGYGEIEEAMGRALYLCSTKSLDRWVDAVRMLESDPVFKLADTARLADDVDPNGLSAEAIQIFQALSSGHQIVLLTITSLVAHLEERTLVLMDEPEGHLHPPLLSALVRALSTILTERNAFAIVATHSPVILQEVPAKCVHLVARTASGLAITRPRSETFGENVGVLTREVFGLEVEASGFHRLLTEVALSSPPDFSAIAGRFDGELGSEALALVLAHLNSRNASIPTRLDF